MQCKPSFLQQEDFCQKHFEADGPYFHVYSPDNMPVMFLNANDLNAATAILGLSVLAHPKTRLLTYQIMSNHFHMILAGNCNEIENLMDMFLEILVPNIRLSGCSIDTRAFVFRRSQIPDLEYMRNVIPYVNRNGFLVRPDETPFTYPWGANRFYFNRELKNLHEKVWKPVTQVQRRELTHSRKFDKQEKLFQIDGTISPFSFCDIERGESMFRDARHYFGKISKGVETFSSIAKSIGESVYYTDDELFSSIMALARKNYSVEKLANLTSDGKIDLAKVMKYNYNASNKQIQRMLKLDSSVVESLFGQ